MSEPKLRSGDSGKSKLEKKKRQISYFTHSYCQEENVHLPKTQESGRPCQLTALENLPGDFQDILISFSNGSSLLRSLD